ncbi:MAG: hypothetical protein K6T72_00485 [Anoxybacillus sp.]|nr:hypothetical protein [Anoxybacillus sp.]MCL6584993.1 hypothetical protein [Anoxybacillus sp.]
MLQTSLSKAVLDQAARQIHQELSHPLYESAMKKGLKLYREGFVYNAQLMEEDVVQANVLDRSVYKPVLDLFQLSQSECQCSSTYFCPHLFALFFYLYANVGQVGDLVRQWNTKQQETTKRPTIIQKPAPPAASIAAWEKQFEQSFAYFLQRHRPSDYWFAHYLCYRFFPSLIEKISYKGTEKWLYHLHAALFTFSRLVQYSKPFQQSSYQRAFWDSAIADFFSVIHNKCNLVANQPNRTPYTALFEELRKYVQHALLSSESLYLEWRLRAYGLLWQTLFNDKHWIDKEKQELRANKPLTDEHRLALVQLAFMSKEDDDIPSLLQQVSIPLLPYALVWIRQMASNNEWERMRMIWELCFANGDPLAGIPLHRRGEIANELLARAERYANETNDKKLYEHTLRALLPYSASDYSLYLLENEQYKQWVELHIIAGIDIETIHRPFLSMIEKRDCSLLLPLYHRAVDERIRAKNRASYKEAVRYLKKIRAAYRALGRYGTWRDYRDRLCEETKRLRAFQEELQKGKLLHD